ncbi:MAG TPA: peptidase dimerization domain-containing protein, partial [Thermomicrobiaceae bacterium]|nr:peptidase dimerization domain-containing protein [Thermomicrobiaceae bacterium]
GDVDASLMVHHAGDRTGAPTQFPAGTCLAVNHMTVEYFGKPAHAAADPYNGVNALNAVIKLFTGIDALRQHIQMEARIHGIITHGGDAPNVVPKYTAARLYVRAASRAYMEEVFDKVKKIAEGAALMTGCEVKVTEDSVCYDMRPSYAIGKTYRENMQAVGMDINERGPARGMHSTDFGNISYLMPSVTGSFAISHEPIPGHSQQVVDASGSDFGREQLLKVSKAMALTALDLFLNPELLQSAKDERSRWAELYEK